MGELIRVDFVARCRMDRLNVQGLRAAGISDAAIRNLQALVDDQETEDETLNAMIADLKADEEQFVRLAQSSVSVPTTREAAGGSRYVETQDLARKDITKLVRKYARTKYPEIKFSGRTSGRTIYLTIQDVPASVALFNPQWLDYQRSHPHMPTPMGMSRYTQYIQGVISDIKDYANSFNYDLSDLMTDYFDCRFYLDVSVDWQLENARRTSECA